MKTIKIGKASLEVAVSKSRAAQKRGLMYIKSLPCNHGMLFEYPKEQKLTFWMKNTKIPLSIAFIDKNKKIIEIQDMDPYDEKKISSEGKAKWALETNQGWFEKNNITVGDSMLLSESRMIKIKIVKLPPEAEALAKKIEDVLTKMITKAVEAKIGPGSGLKNVVIDVEE